MFVDMLEEDEEDEDEEEEEMRGYYYGSCYKSYYGAWLLGL